MDIYLSQLTEQLIYPPSGPLLVLLAGLLLPHSRIRIRRILIGIGLLSLYCLSLFAVTAWLSDLIEVHSPLPPESLAFIEADAIVVLGGGRYPAAPEYGGSTTDAVELERLRYAAFVHARTGIPIAVIGGDGLHTGIQQSDLMQAVLEQEFDTGVRWSDGRSSNTIDNARYAAEILLPEERKRIVLVTHASHMTRAMELFEAEGFAVTPAPTGFFRPKKTETGIMAWIPSASAMRLNNRILHEIAGLIWNRIV